VPKEAPAQPLAQKKERPRPMPPPDPFGVPPVLFHSGYPLEAFHYGALFERTPVPDEEAQPPAPEQEAAVPTEAVSDVGVSSVSAGVGDPGRDAQPEPDDDIEMEADAPGTAVTAPSAADEYFLTSGVPQLYAQSKVIPVYEYASSMKALYRTAFEHMRVHLAAITSSCIENAHGVPYEKERWENNYRELRERYKSSRSTPQCDEKTKPIRDVMKYWKEQMLKAQSVMQEVSEAWGDDLNAMLAKTGRMFSPT